MPRKKNYVRKTTRRSYKRSNKLRFQRSPIADKALVTFKYADQISIDPGAGTISSHFFRANSLYDPDLTGVGHQPLGLDQWANFYRAYTVIGSKIKVTFDNGHNIEGVMCGLRIDKDQSTPLFWSSADFMESRQSKYITCENGDGNSQKVLTASLNPCKYFNVSKPLGDSELQGFLASSNPVKEAYYQVAVGAVDAASNLQSVRCLVEIEYIAILRQPIDLASS